LPEEECWLLETAQPVDQKSSREKGDHRYGQGDADPAMRFEQATIEKEAKLGAEKLVEDAD